MLSVRRFGHRAFGCRSSLSWSPTPNISSRASSTNAAIHHASGPENEGPQTGRLSGRTIAVKDNIDTQTLPTTAASKILSGYTSPFEATVVKLLKQNGAIITSKSNLDEFGMGSHSQNSAIGPVSSLYSRSGVALSPGGSSGGSAVAVASGQCWAALGTDTGGSVRLPAAYTGIVGFKPSYGSLSRWGVIQYANSLDTVGVLAKKVADARSVFEASNAHDAHDPTSLSKRVRARIAVNRANLPRQLTIGIPMDYNIEELSPAVKSAYTATLKTLRDQGHRLKPVNLRSTRKALSAYYVLAPAEASSNLAKYDGIRYGQRTEGTDASPSKGLPLYAETRGEGFGAEVKRRILLGAYTLSSEAIDNYFIQAQKVRRLVQQYFDSIFALPNPLLDSQPSGDGVDFLLTPTAPTLPPTVEEVRRASPVESYMNDVFTVPASLAGLPAISLPVALPEVVRQGMETRDVQSTGMQIIGQFGDDAGVLHLAETIEEAVQS